MATRKKPFVKGSKKAMEVKRISKPVTFIVREGYEEDEDDFGFDDNEDEDDFSFWEFTSKVDMENFLKKKQKSGCNIQHFKVYQIANRLIPVVNVGLKFTIKK